MLGFFKCSVCGQLYNSKEKLDDHTRMRHPKEEKVTAKAAGSSAKATTSTTTKATRKMQHGKVASPSKATGCPFCSKKTFTVKHVVRAHLKKLEDYVDNYVVPKPVVYENELDEDIAYLLGDDNSNDKSARSGHVKFKCPCCDTKQLQSKQALRIHVRSHITKHSGFITCDLCKEVLPGRLSYKRHLKLQHNNSTSGLNFKMNSLSCHQCLQSFKTRSSLSWHMKCKHQISCQLCEETFNKESDFIYHNRQFHQPLCPYCLIIQNKAKTFSNAQLLSRHITQMHLKTDRTDDFIFRCKFCLPSLIFTNGSDFIQHWQKVHSGGLCPVRLCNRCFASPEKLAEHKNKQHNFSYPCGKCSQSFPSYPKFLHHKLNYHGKNATKIRLEKLCQCKSEPV